MIPISFIDQAGSHVVAQVGQQVLQLAFLILLCFALPRSSIGEGARRRTRITMARAKQTYSYVEEWKKGWEPELEAIAYNGATCDPTRVDPKVLQWVQDNCSSQGQPHFVKIINPNAANGRPGLLLKNSGSLTVPSPFVREHFRKLARVVTLEDERGTRRWRVSFGAPKRDPQWLQGWDRVAADNNFQPGDVVVFVLVDNSRFRFTHFDAHGNLNADFGPNVAAAAAVKPEFNVRRCLSSQESRDQVHSVDDDDDDAANTTDTRALVRPTFEESPSCKERKLQRTAFDPFTFSIKSKRRVTTVVERKRAQDAAMAFAYTLNQAQAEPHFVAIMSPTQVYHKFHMVVPESFVTNACLPATATSATRLLLQDGGGGHSWEMLMKRNRNNNNNEFYFHRKLWALYALHHLLEDGDFCVFRLPINQPANQASQACTVLVVLVHMFRVVPVSAANQAGNQVSPHDHFALHKLSSATEQLGDEVMREQCSGDEKTGKQRTEKPRFCEKTAKTAKTAKRRRENERNCES